MNKQTIITALFALVAMAGQAKTFKTIKTPEAMAYVNVINGELKAREVIFRDTATTVHFTMEYPKGFNGIPHYETITPDCRRVREDLRISGYEIFENQLQRLLEKLR